MNVFAMSSCKNGKIKSIDLKVKNCKYSGTKNNHIFIKRKKNSRRYFKVFVGVKIKLPNY